MLKVWQKSSSKDVATRQTEDLLQSDLYSARGSYGLKECYNGSSTLVDVVFVHGLTGNRETTWTNKAGVFWPRDLLGDDLPEARILTFGYDADVVHFWATASQNRIRDHAQNLVNALVQLRERTDTNKRPVIFVVHSLGGLVVEDALSASKYSAERHIRQFVDCVSGIAFLGTPHCGADLAVWATILGNFTNMIKSTNTSLLSVLQPNSEVLARIQQDFHGILRTRRDLGLRDIGITCFYEELPVQGAGFIVPKHSAKISGYTAIGIRANHMDMPKFESREDPGYRYVSNELWRWARTIESTPESQHQLSRIEPGSSQLSTEQGSTFGSRGDQGSQPGNSPVGQNEPSNPQVASSEATSQTQHEEEAKGRRVYQGGNIITGSSTVSGGGKVVQGINISADRDVNLSF